MKQNSCLYKKKKMKSARSSEVEDASSRKSKRRPLANRRARIFFYSKELFPFSKAGIAQNHEAGSLSGCVVTRHMQLGALRKPRAEPGFEPRFSKDRFVRTCRHSSHAPAASQKLRTLCQKARNGHCSSIHRLPTNSARIVPVEEAKFL